MEAKVTKKSLQGLSYKESKVVQEDEGMWGHQNIILMRNIYMLMRRTDWKKESCCCRREMGILQEEANKFQSWPSYFLVTSDSCLRWGRLGDSVG